MNQPLHHNPFLDALVEDLRPVVRPATLPRVLLVWLVSTSLFVVVSLLARAPLRPGAWTDVLALGGEGISFGLGLAAAIASMAVGLEWAVPGRSGRLKLWLPAVVLVTSWIGHAGLEVLAVYAQAAHTAPVIDMMGKRLYCEIEVLLQSLPCLLIAAYALKRRVVRLGPQAMFWIGLGAAAVPALWMELACMSDPLHGLLHHLGPVLFVACASAAVGFALRNRPL